MALTIGTHPGEVITNAPIFSVTTSLTESASIQNLRVRASIYIGGQEDAVAVLEQPKGLATFDLFELLKSLTGKCDVAPFGSTTFNQPGYGSQLITGWTQFAAGFSTFSTSGREIVSAIGSGDYAESNDLGSGEIGDIWVVGVEQDYTDSGVLGNYIDLVFAETSPVADPHRIDYAGLSGVQLIPNHIYFFRSRVADTTPRVFLGKDSGTVSFAGTFACHKISDFHNNPGVYFEVAFQEVYENSSDVTQVGAASYSDCMLFVPASVRPGENFDDYILDTSPTGTKKSPSRAADSFYKFGIGMELRAMNLCTGVWMRTNVVIDSGTVTQNNMASMGWGMFTLNETSLPGMDADDETISFRAEIMTAYSGSSVYQGVYIVVPTELRCLKDMRAISFVGDLGEETVLFRNLFTKTGSADKTFYKNVQRIRKVLKAYKRKNQVLRSLYETEDFRELVHEMVYTEMPVWLYGTQYDDGYTEVTVISDEADIVDQNELIESEIEIEYYE